MPKNTIYPRKNFQKLILHIFIILDNFDYYFKMPYSVYS